jgi:hypothetical protein
LRGTRALIVAVVAALALAGPAQAAPKMPSSTKGSKRCGISNNGFADFRVFVTKGKSVERRVAAQGPQGQHRRDPQGVATRWGG